MRFKTVGERVSYARKQSGLSVQKLAKAAGLAPSTIYDLQRGDSKSTTKLPAIAHATGFSARWLESETGPMRSEHPVPSTVADTAATYQAPTDALMIDVDALTVILDEMERRGFPRDNRDLAINISTVYTRLIRSFIADGRRHIDTILAQSMNDAMSVRGTSAGESEENHG